MSKVIASEKITIERRESNFDKACDEWCKKKRNGSLRLWTAQPKNKNKGLVEFVNISRSI